MKVSTKKQLQQLFILALLILVLNGVCHYFFYRFDLTQDKRYTLSDASLSIIEKVKEPLYIDVFLEGKFPGDIKRLQTETKQLLEEFKAYNENIVFQFINPLEEQELQEETLNSFVERGLLPLNVTIDDKGKRSEELVFPWAVASCEDRSTKIPLLKNMAGASLEEKVSFSVQNLEYAIAQAIYTVAEKKTKKIAVLKGNKPLDDILMADALKQIRENYYIAPFTLDSVARDAKKTAKLLQGFDMAILAKPNEKFNDEEKLVLDQYVMQGGKMLWLIDAVSIEMDSLYNPSGQTLAFPKALQLDDMFFKYGFRINATMVKDIMASPIALATGNEGSGTQLAQYPWFYSPMVYPLAGINHPIVKNLDAIKFEFANSIDTLKNGIKKTVLLQSSKASKAIGTPQMVSLEMVTERPEPASFENQGSLPLAVLLEGNFTSMFKNRVLPITDFKIKENSVDNKMIVVADGDIIKNQLGKNFEPLELGYDKWTKSYYSNKEFIINCVNYLLDDNGLINIRNKEVVLPLLDRNAVYENYFSIQVQTIALPLVLLVLFGISFTWMRKRQYSK